MRVLAYPYKKNTHINPYTRLLYDNMPKNVFVKDINIKDLLIGNFDIIHLHWAPENIIREKYLSIAFFKSFIFILLLFLSKIRKKRIYQSAHDTKAHSIKHKKLYFLVKYFIDLSVNESIPVDKYHGHYADYYQNKVSEIDAKQYYKIEKPCILFFGMIEKYKGLKDLWKAYSPVSNSYNLIVAGKATKEMYPLLREINKNPNTRVFPYFIEEDQVQYLFNACDLVVLPFKEILNSGTVYLCLSFNKPVLASEKGNLLNVHKRFPDHVNLYTGILNSHMIDQCVNKTPIKNVDLEQLSWSRLSEQLYSDYYAQGAEATKPF